MWEYLRRRWKCKTGKCRTTFLHFWSIVFHLWNLVLHIHGAAFSGLCSFSGRACSSPDFPRPIVKVCKLYSAAPFVSSSQLPLACHIFLLWATHKLHLLTLAVKKLINDFSGTCLTLPLVFSPYGLHPETALLLPEWDLQQSTLDQLLEQNVLHLQSSTVC